MEKSKSKRKFSSPSHKPNPHPQPHHPHQAKPVQLIIYNPKNPKSKKQNQLKLKQDPPSKKRVNTSNYDFPQFKMYKQKPLKPHSQRENAHPITKHQKSKVEKQKVSVIQQSKKTTARHHKKQHTPNKKQQNLTTQSNTLEIPFKVAVEKIFKMLDIFNRGKITETNISQWIPESSLYFLGKPLQKIKNQRLQLTQQDFVTLCMPLLTQSTLQDLQEFITETNKCKTLKASVNITDHQSSISPIRKRMIEQELQKSGKQSKLITKNSQLDSIMNLIHSRQAQLSQKIRDVRSKRKSINLQLQQSKTQSFNNSALINYNKNPSESILKASHLNYPQIKLVQSIHQCNALKSSANTSESALFNKKQQQNQNPHQTDNPYVANFTFQLPQIPTKIQDKFTFSATPEKIKDSKDPTSIEKRGKPQLYAYYKPLSDRLINRNLQQSKIMRQNFQADSMRLDLLSSKVQHYMRVNALIMQKTRSFINQNSPHKY